MSSDCFLPEDQEVGSIGSATFKNDPWRTTTDTLGEKDCGQKQTKNGRKQAGELAESC